jgi:NhaP-type Na+/H+ or K+/H+ antiporter
MFPYIRLFGLLALTGILSHWLTPGAIEHLSGHHESALLLAFFHIAAIFGVSFLAYQASAKTRIPAFVTAILFGLVNKPLLEGIIASEQSLAVIVGVSAALILFGGGLETSLREFGKTLGKIFSLSFVGLFITASLFASTLLFIANLLGIDLFVGTAILAGAILASTDPAAIIPVLKQLRFRHRTTPTLIISESAVTDAVGTILTFTILGFILAGQTFDTVIQAYGQIFSFEVLTHLLMEISIGILAGLLGYLLLKGLIHLKKTQQHGSDADTAFFFFVPVIIFLGALALGGSGYLAVFVTGLFIRLNKQLRDTDRFFNQSIDAFLKPAIFLLLGALIDPNILVTYAPLGLLASAIFIFIIRPVAVLGSLGPLKLFSPQIIWWKDIWFISWVRETGAIPAVLLISVAGLGIPQADIIIAVGMWVIVTTLLLQPMLTPWVAEKLGVAEMIEDEEEIDEVSDKPFVLLGTRGYSFARRLPFVVDWAVKHGIHEVVVLLCLEGRHTKKLAIEMEEKLDEAAAEINKGRKCDKRKCVEIRMISNKGFLQDNIKRIAKSDDDLTIIFIGKRVLDYRLEELKQIPVPFYFMD